LVAEIFDCQEIGVKALLIGGAGFVGGFLARSLVDDGVSVDILDNFQRGVKDGFLNGLVESGRVQLLSGDIRDAAFVDTLGRDYDVIYHLAAIIGVRHVLERPYEVLVENVKMTEAAIKLARMQNKLSRLLFTSTSEVYAGSLIHMNMPVPTPESFPIALTDLGQARTSYMLSKLYGEAMCNFAGVPVTNVRLHNVYGPRMGMSHVIPELLHRAWKSEDGASLDVASVGHKRTFCFVTDAVRMIRALVDCPEAVSQTVNIGNQAPEVTIGHVAEVVCKTVGRDLNINALPETPGSPARRCPDTQKLFDLTQVRGDISLEDGVRATYSWYLENVFSGDGVTAQ
jgi:nucleoside-diphosphate-sugar epimerase